MTFISLEHWAHSHHRSSNAGYRDLYIRGGRQAENLPLVETSKELRTLGIGAVGQHGALLPAVHSKYYDDCARNEVTADTKSGDLHHPHVRVKLEAFAGLQSLADEEETDISPATRDRIFDRLSRGASDPSERVFNTEVHPIQNLVAIDPS